MKHFFTYFKKALILTVALLVLCAVIYPLLVTGIGKAAFPHKAGGSMIEVGGQVLGSELIGQQFTEDMYFHGRISAVNYNTYTAKEKADGTYAGVASGSSNYGSSNEALKERVKADVEAFKARYKEAVGTELTQEIPADMLTASGSGLDPHISPASAQLQIPIVAANSGLSEEEVAQIVENNTEGKALGIFGEERVNVLKCNIAVAQATGKLPQDTAKK